MTLSPISAPKGGSLVATYLTTLRSPSSQRAMRSSLRTVTRLLVEDAELDSIPVDPEQVDWAALDWATCNHIRHLMRGRWATSTMNRHLAAVRGIIKVAHMLGLVGTDRAQRCQMALANEPATHHGVNPVGRLISHGELHAIFETLAHDHTTIARRDAATIAILAMGGTRRSETCALDLDDWYPATGELLVRHGKGDKQRKVWLHSGAVAALDDWLAVRGDLPGPLLLRVRRGGHIVHGESGRITAHALWKRVTHLADRAHIKPITPHDFRRKMISDALDHGDDLSAVQQLAGHANITTTARYDRRGEHAARRAASHLVVPYVAPSSSLSHPSNSMS